MNIAARELIGNNREVFRHWCADERTAEEDRMRRAKRKKVVMGK